MFWCSLSNKVNVTHYLIFHVTVIVIGSAPDISTSEAVQSYPFHLPSCIFANNTSCVSHGPTQPSASGNSSSSTFYSSICSKFFISFHTVFSAKNYLLCKDMWSHGVLNREESPLDLFWSEPLWWTNKPLPAHRCWQTCTVVLASLWILSVSFVYVSATWSSYTPVSPLHWVGHQREREREQQWWRGNWWIREI